MKQRVGELGARVESLLGQNEHLTRLVEELRSQLNALEISRQAIRNALSEREEQLAKFQRQEQNQKKKPAKPSFVQNDESLLKKKIEELNRAVTKLSQENKMLAEQTCSLDKARTKEQKSAEACRREMDRLLQELEQYRHYVKDNSQGQMSLRKKSDLIRLESELRNKNSYIDSLLETIKELKGRVNNPGLNRSNNSNAQRFSGKHEPKSVLDLSKNSLNR